MPRPPEKGADGREEEKELRAGMRRMGVGARRRPAKGKEMRRGSRKRRWEERGRSWRWSRWRNGMCGNQEDLEGRFGVAFSAWVGTYQAQRFRRL